MEISGGITASLAGRYAAALYDLAIFGVVPDAVSLIGGVVILCGAGLLAWREGRLRT